MLDLTKILFEASPNFTKGRTAKLDYIILHAMAGTYIGSKAWFKNPKAKVSATYLVSQKGELVQMVHDSDTAWHCYGINNKSIGIEMEDKGHCLKDGTWITPELWNKVVDLVVALCKKYSIPVSHIDTHSAKWIQDIGRSRGMAHADPGPFFNLTKFRQEVQAKLDAHS